jgi:hypothetical protein
VAIHVLDVRGTAARPLVALPSRRDAGTPRLPLSALVAGLISVVEAVALLAVALQGLDTVLSTSLHPAGPVVTLGLLALAGWIVLAAGSGATLIDGSGRRTLVGLSVAELAGVAVLGIVATATPVPAPASLPLPGLLLLAAAVPVAKLLLAGSPSAVAWVAAAPRVVEHRPDPATTHRVLATVTLAVIGLGLAAVALLTPVDASAGPGDTASTVVYQP